MTGIYNFEAVQPPVLSEKTLRTEAERRRTKRHTTWLAISGALLQLCILMMSFFLQPFNMTLAVLGFLYFFVSFSGSGVIMIVFTLKRRSFV